MSRHRKLSPWQQVKVVVSWCCLTAAALAFGAAVFVAGWMLSGDPLLTAWVEAAAALIAVTAAVILHCAGWSRRVP